MSYLSIYSASEFAIALGVVLAAGIVRGFTGFGAGLVMVPLMALIWGPVEALATSVMIGLSSTIQLAPRAIPLTNWRDMGPMMAAILVATPIGTVLLVSLDPEIIKKTIAVLVLLVSLITIWGWTYRGPRGPLPSAIAGAIGGVVNGIAGVGGPALVLYLIALPEEAKVHRANIVMALAVTSIVSVTGLAIAGAIGTRVLTHTVVFVIPSILSVWIGAKLFTILPVHWFKIMILWFLIAISIAILFA